MRVRPSPEAPSYGARLCWGAARPLKANEEELPVNDSREFGDRDSEAPATDSSTDPEISRQPGVSGRSPGPAPEDARAEPEGAAGGPQQDNRQAGLAERDAHPGGHGERGGEPRAHPALADEEGAAPHDGQGPTDILPWEGAGAAAPGTPGPTEMLPWDGDDGLTDWGERPPPLRAAPGGETGPQDPPAGSTDERGEAGQAGPAGEVEKAGEAAEATQVGQPGRSGQAGEAGPATEVNQPGWPGQTGPAAAASRRLWALPVTPRVLTMFGIAIVSVAAVSMFLGWLWGSPGPGEAQPAPGASRTQPEGTLRSQAEAIDALLDGSTSARRDVVDAVVNVRRCREFDSSARDLRAAARQRERMVAKLEELDVGKLPRGEQIVAALSRAWTKSAEADRAFAAWTERAGGQGGCPNGAPVQGSHYRTAVRASSAASEAKAAFVRHWNPVAAETGFPSRGEDEI